MYTPVNPSFTRQKWGLRGSNLYKHVFVMGTLSDVATPLFFENNQNIIVRILQKKYCSQIHVQINYSVSCSSFILPFITFIVCPVWSISAESGQGLHCPLTEILDTAECMNGEERPG